MHLGENYRAFAFLVGSYGTVYDLVKNSAKTQINDTVHDTQHYSSLKIILLQYFQQ